VPVARRVKPPWVMLCDAVINLWWAFDEGGSAGMGSLSEAAVLADAQRRAALEVGGVYGFNLKEAALCKLHGWEHVEEVRIRRVTAAAVIVACKTAAGRNQFYGGAVAPVNA
jgi:hypothetical protein